MPILRVDGSRTIDETVDAVQESFAAAIKAGPRAESTAERTTLLRKANLAIVRQVEAGHARPWAEGDAGEIVRTLPCECGDPSCDRDVAVEVAVAARWPVLAPEHVAVPSPRGPGS